MNAKKDFFRMCACLIGCMLLFAAWVVITDPFHHYHAPWLGMPTILEDVVYQTPGNATNFSYDSAIVGTSMTENFRVSWFDEELGWDTMKLCYAGAACNDLHAILDCVYDGDRQVDHILMDLNDYQLTSGADVSYVERPEYLYTKTFLDDYRYVYNRDVFVKGIRLALDAFEKRESNIETAYTWEEDVLFGKEKALEASRLTKDTLLQSSEEKLLSSYVEAADFSTEVITPQEEVEEALACCQDNLDQILPYMKAHPETEYIIFFPPYSMLYWEQLAIKDELEEMIAVYTYTVEQLLPYENVKIYYFHGEDFITDLDEYRDATHHKPEYNRYIFDCIKEDKNRLTEENYKDEIGKVYELVSAYDYEKLWE